MASPSPIYCNNCGAANQAQTMLCFACGQLLAAAVEDTSRPSQADSPASLALLAGRYRIIDMVGKGGFGAVYKAQDLRRNGALVAIKSINLHGLSPEEIIEATDTFNREVSLLSTLVHPNLPRIYDHFTDPEHWYLVMDFIEGETLEEYLEAAGTRQKKYFFGLLPARKSLPASAAQGTQQASRLPVREVLDIAIQLCKVLNYLHMRQPPVIFRDVKPANIMRNPRGHIYLIDF